MGIKHLIQSPRLWRAHGSERRVTWTELFFDVIFVAAVAQVGAPLAADYAPAGLVRYSFLLVLIWLAWSGHTAFVTRFDSDDLIQRLLILAQCFLAAVMAANGREALDTEASAGFAAAYSGMRVVLVMQYLRARRVKETRTLTTRFAVGFGVAALLWLVSAMAPIPLRYWLWGAALAVDIGTPWLARHHCLRFPPDAAHFPERFGLFTLILIGEFVASVMNGIESQPTWSVGAASTALAAMAFAFALRWWYFDGAQSTEHRHIRGKQDALAFEIWTYAHLLLFLGVGVAGVGFEHAISLKEGESLHSTAVFILCGAVALLMAALITIGATSVHARNRQRRVRQVSGQVACLSLVGALAVYPEHWPPLFLVLGLLGACVAQLVLADGQGLLRTCIPRPPGERSLVTKQPIQEIPG